MLRDPFQGASQILFTDETSVEYMEADLFPEAPVLDPTTVRINRTFTKQRLLL